MQRNGEEAVCIVLHSTQRERKRSSPRPLAVVKKGEKRNGESVVSHFTPLLSLSLLVWPTQHTRGVTTGGFLTRNVNAYPAVALLSQRMIVLFLPLAVLGGAQGD